MKGTNSNHPTLDAEEKLRVAAAQSSSLEKAALAKQEQARAAKRRYKAARKAFKQAKKAAKKAAKFARKAQKELELCMEAVNRAKQRVATKTRRATAAKPTPRAGAAALPTPKRKAIPRKSALPLPLADSPGLSGEPHPVETVSAPGPAPGTDDPIS